jgi:tRNA(Ile)-lysidine synthase
VDVKSYAAKEKCSEEDAGRRLRYSAFEEAASAFGANKIAVAHNACDRAETMLFRLFRGSGLKGLKGILPVRDGIIRPLLELERQEIEDYLRREGIAWRTDSTNAQDDYARNRIRHHILPYAEKEIFPGAVAHMCRTADMLAETEDYLELETKKALEGCLAADCPYVAGERSKVLDVEAFLRFHPVLQKRMLLAVLESLSRTGKDIESVHVMAALGLFSQETGKSIDLPMGITAFRQYGWVVFERGMEERQEELPIPRIDFEVFFKKNDMEVPEKRYTKWFDYDKIKRQPEVRYRQTGDYLTLSDGRGGMIHKSLKDYMVTEKIPRQQRGRIPVLAEGSHVLWLVGYRISEYYKVDGNTKRILQAKLEQRVQKSPTEEKNGGTHQSTFIGGRG